METRKDDFEQGFWRDSLGPKPFRIKGNRRLWAGNALAIAHNGVGSIFILVGGAHLVCLGAHKHFQVLNDCGGCNCMQNKCLSFIYLMDPREIEVLISYRICMPKGKQQKIMCCMWHHPTPPKICLSCVEALTQTFRLPLFCVQIHGQGPWKHIL